MYATTHLFNQVQRFGWGT